MEEVNRVALDIVAVECVDGNESNLCVGLLVHLGAKVFDLGDRGLVENAGKVVDVAGGLERGDRLGAGETSQNKARQKKKGKPQTKLCAERHRKIVQEWQELRVAAKPQSAIGKLRSERVKPPAWG